MIEIKEIELKDVDIFWDKHISYLINDNIIEDEEDISYFKSREYKDVIESHMVREKDKHTLAYFIKDGVEIGAASYCIYSSEDGKCFILDFWIYEEYRNKGLGHECFLKLAEYTKKRGAKYYEINSEKDASIRFWQSLGFAYNGKDEWGMKLFIRK